MDDELILDFFKSFSRFEYALKAAGRAKAGLNDAAEADWGSVENALRDVDRAEIVAKAGILLSDPPRRQVFKDAQLKWKPAGDAGGEVQNIVASLKRVRNNLFHGGKYSATATYVSERQRQLVNCARTVLDVLIRLPALTEVAARFNGYDGQEG